MRIVSFAAVSGLALALMAMPVQAQEGGNSSELEPALAAGWKAGFICSATFNAGQSLAEIESNELDGIYPDYIAAYNRLPAADIDNAGKTVSVTYSNDMPPRIAAWRPGFGCSQLAIGATKADVQWLPRFDGYRAPTGTDRGSAIGANVKIGLNTDFVERVEAPVTFAFDEMTYGNGTRTSAVVVVQNGQVLSEQYARGIDHETPQRTWSVAKSISATILGAARNKGHIGLDTPAVIEDFNNGGDPRRNITLRNLLHMSSGLDSGKSGSRTDRIDFGGGRVIDQAADNVLEAKPGTRFKYANNDTLIALRSLRESIGDDAKYHAFPHQEVLNKIGATRTTIETDWDGDYIGSSQVWSTARDLARIGQLYLQDGYWGRERILADGWVDFVKTPAPAQPTSGAAGYGAQFWLMNDTQGVPEDTYFAAGNRGQYIVIVPSRKAVIVRRGYDINGGARFDIHAFTRDVIGGLDAAATARAEAALAAEKAEMDAQRLAEEEQAASEASNQSRRESVRSKVGRR